MTLLTTKRAYYKVKLHGENFVISSAKSARFAWERGRLVRGDNQVNMVFVEGLPRILGSSKSSGA